MDGLEPNLAPATPPPAPKQARKRAIGMPQTVRIILEENDGIPPTGQFFGLNGQSYLIRPGEPVDVPRGIIDILMNAVVSAPVTDPATKQVIGHREKMRYPFRRLDREGDE